MIKLNKSQLLTKNEMDVLSRHTMIDISFREGGTFNKDMGDNDCDFPFDKKEANIARRALLKIITNFTQK